MGTLKKSEMQFLAYDLCSLSFLNFQCLRAAFLALVSTEQSDTKKSPQIGSLMALLTVNLFKIFEGNRCFQKHHRSDLEIFKEFCVEMAEVLKN